MGDSERQLEADLPATTLAPSAARRMLEQLLVASGQSHLADDARLVISELVTNAIRHASNSTTLHLALHVDGDGTLRAAITDSSALAPMVRELAIEDEAGRGMQIVQQLTTRWGVEQDRSGGKQVWVELR
jgi:anti-sigma regulatory factor (Ser/Thr protein kinase)